MKMTNFQIGTCVDILSNLNETGKFGYAVAKNLRKLCDEGKEYLDMRMQLFQKYGKPDKGGMRMTISAKENPEGYAEYMKEMGDIPNEEVDVDIYQIDEETFYSGHLTSTQMANLLWMVKGNEPEKVEGEVV